MAMVEGRLLDLWHAVSGSFSDDSCLWWDAGMYLPSGQLGCSLSRPVTILLH